MMPSTFRVLNMLRFKKSRGVIFDDFPKGMCCTKRIADLRQAGYHITTTFETLLTGCRRARWHLIKEPKCKAR